MNKERFIFLIQSLLDKINEREDTEFYVGLLHSKTDDYYELGLLNGTDWLIASGEYGSGGHPIYTLFPVSPRKIDISITKDSFLEYLHKILDSINKEKDLSYNVGMGWLNTDETYRLLLYDGIECVLNKDLFRLDTNIPIEPTDQFQEITLDKSK